MKNESWGRRIWRLAYPGLTYFGICFIIEIIAAVFIALGTAAGQDFSSVGAQVDLINVMMEKTLSIALNLQVLAAAVTLPILLLYYRQDKKREAGNGTGRRYTAVPCRQFLLVVILGVSACLMGNNLIMASGLYSVSDGYEKIAELLYGGKLILEFVGLGVMVPIVEEMIFRGLMYRRMREYMNIGPAAVVCSLIFGMYHGNLVQGVYAFLLGMLFIYSYERYHTMLAPILFHIAANLFSVAVSEFGFLDVMYGSAGTFWGGTILVCVVLIFMVYLIERFVHSEEIVPEPEGREEQE